MTKQRMILNENGLMMLPIPDSISKNEYIALELVRSWALGLPNRSTLYMSDILNYYDKAINYLNKKEKYYE